MKKPKTRTCRLCNATIRRAEGLWMDEGPYLPDICPYGRVLSMGNGHHEPEPTKKERRAALKTELLELVDHLLTKIEELE